MWFKRLARAYRSGLSRGVLRRFRGRVRLQGSGARALRPRLSIELGCRLKAAAPCWRKQCRCVRVCRSRSKLLARCVRLLGRDAEIGRRKTTGLNVAVFIQSGIFRRTGNGNFVVTAAVYDKTAFHAEFFERLCDRFDQSRVVNADDGIVGMRRIGLRADDVEDGEGRKSGTSPNLVYHGSLIELS